MNEEKKIVLCSASPRRQQLLKELGFDFEILPGDVDERFSPHLQAEEIALFLAEKKAEALRQKFQPGKIYITADTIVCFHDEVLVKPVDADDAFNMLKKLLGNRHQVYTGVCLAGVEWKKLFHVRSDVHFRKLRDDEIRFYIDHYQPFDKAGAYGAQECLPEGMNPCSAAEIGFLKSIGKSDLFERTTLRNKKHMPVIERIDGSYFNVMGLPVVELYKELVKWRSERQ